MNKIYLDEDRTIEAQISSDASIQADESTGKDRKISTKNLSIQYSLYIEEIKKDLSRHLNAIIRDFYNSISIFLDEQVYSQKNRKLNICDTLRNWRPKLQQFQKKFEQLKQSMPYVSGQKIKNKVPTTKKIKFSQQIDKYINKIELEYFKSETSSKFNLEKEFASCQNLYEQTRYQEAIVKTKQILKLNPNNLNNPEVFFLMGNCYKAIGSYKEAIHQYDKALKISTKGSYYNNRGNCYLCLGEISKAQADYKKAIKQQPNNEVFLGNYGNVCLSLKKYEQAIISYNLALKAGPPNDFFYNNRAFAQIKLRRYQQAIQSYNQAINLNPNNHVYYKNRSNLYMEKGNIEKAISDICEAIEIQPNKHQYFFLKGKWEYYSKKPRQALLSFRKACQLDPGKKTYCEFYRAIKEQLSLRK